MSDSPTYVTPAPPAWGATAQPTADVTDVMGRRTLAWIIDLVLYFGVIVGMFAALAEYVEVPEGLAGTVACDQLQAQAPDAAAGCFTINDRAYITTAADNGIQTGAAFGYFVVFVVMQGAIGASPGKLVTGLRVVKADGTRAGIGRSLVRSLLWIVDGAPWFAPAVGFITGLSTTGHRRVGDMAASTYVVSRRSMGTPVVATAVSGPVGAPAWGAPPVATDTWTTPTPHWPSTPPPTAVVPAAAPSDLPAPQWDPARNTYIQWDPAQSAWLQWDTAANQWKSIDS